MLMLYSWWVCLFTTQWAFSCHMVAQSNVSMYSLKRISSASYNRNNDDANPLFLVACFCIWTFLPFRTYLFISCQRRTIFYSSVTADKNYNIDDIIYYLLIYNIISHIIAEKDTQDHAFLMMHMQNLLIKLCILCSISFCFG